MLPKGFTIDLYSIKKLNYILVSQSFMNFVLSKSVFDIVGFTLFRP